MIEAADPFFLDNQIPSVDFLFLLGYLPPPKCDGSIFIRIRLSSSGSFNFIPALYFPKKIGKYSHVYYDISYFALKV